VKVLDRIFSILILRRVFIHYSTLYTCIHYWIWLQWIHFKAELLRAQVG